jgi:hypothetical protein
VARCKVGGGIQGSWLRGLQGKEGVAWARGSADMLDCIRSGSGANAIVMHFGECLLRRNHWAGSGMRLRGRRAARAADGVLAAGGASSGPWQRRESRAARIAGGMSGVRAGEARGTAGRGRRKWWGGAPPCRPTSEALSWGRGRGPPAAGPARVGGVWGGGENQRRCGRWGRRGSAHTLGRAPC